MSREFGSVKVNTESEEALAFKILFPAQNDFQRLQMITDIQVRTRVSLSVLGVIRRLFSGTGSLDILKTFQEEFNINGLPLDRKSRLEAAEIVAAVRSKHSDDED